MKKFTSEIFFITLYVYALHGVILEAFSAAEFLRPVILLFCDLSVIALGLTAIRERSLYLKICLAFIVISTFSFIWNIYDVNLITHLNGIRQFLIVFFSLMFTRHILTSVCAQAFHHKFNRYVYIFLYLQLLVSIPQFFIFGGGDRVGGTIGSGGSGVLTLLVYILVLYLIIDKSAQEGKAYPDFSIALRHLHFLIPSFINETKITFILIPLFVLVLLHFSRRTIIQSVFALGLFVAIMFLFNKYYSHTLSDEYQRKPENAIQTFTQQEFIQNYLLNQNTENFNISRFTKIKIGFEILSKSTEDMIFGKGYGLFKGRTLIGESDFARRYNWLLYGTNNYLFFLLIQGGIALVLLTVFTFIYPLLPFRKNSSLAIVINRYRLFLVLVFILILFYNTAPKSGVFMLPLAYLYNYINHYIVAVNNPADET